MGRVHSTLALAIAILMLPAAAFAGSENKPAPLSALVKQTPQPDLENTIGLLTGEAEETEFVAATNLASTLSLNQETGPRGERPFRLRTLVGAGGVQNIRSLLTRPDVDLTIASRAMLSRLGEREPSLKRKLVYIAPLYNQELHILARAGIATIADLAGRPVNLGPNDTETGEWIRAIFTAARLRVEPMHMTHTAALDRMRRGELAATVLLSGKPVPLLTATAREDGFRLLPLPSDLLVGSEALRATLPHTDYPNLIGVGQQVDTLAMPAVLVAYSWRPNSQRFRALEAFTQAFITRISELRSDPQHPKWREIDLAATVPGWPRFPPAERLLKAQRSAAADPRVRVDFEEYLKARGLTLSPAQRERMFEDFLHWRMRTKGR